MTEFDVEYLKLVKKILEDGVRMENRTGIDTISIPDYKFNFDVEKEFPVLTTKQTFFKSAIIEMLWIWQMQSNDVRELQKRGVHIWDEWMIDPDGIYRIYEPTGDYDPDREVIVLDPLSRGFDNINGKLLPKYDENGKVMTAKSLIPGKTIREAKYYGKELAYTIGTAYGFITDRYKLTQNALYKAQYEPSDRRIVNSLWQNEFLNTATLPSCVWANKWTVSDGKLNMKVIQRSCDTALGLPFNVTQYACFLKMASQVTGLKPGILSYDISDAHIYVNQLEGIKEQLRREEVYNDLYDSNTGYLYDLREKYENKLSYYNENSDEYKEIDSNIRIIDMILDPSTPTLELDKSITNFFDFDNSKELKHVKIKNYKHMGKIHFPIAQ